MMAQRAAEQRVLQCAGERAGGIELSLEVDGRYHAPHGAQIDSPGFHRERLETKIAGREVQLALPRDLRLRPSRHERIAERPRGLDLERSHRTIDNRLSAETAPER